MIALSQQEKTILALIDPVAEGLGMEIVRVRLMGGNRPILQIMAEKVGGAPTDVEDCANLSHGISPVLEAADPISDPFRLEVSTPGIDRPLTRKGDFGRWAGHLAKVELAMPISGRRRFQGIIQREDDRGVAIELDDESELVAQVEDMSKASLILTDELIDAAQKAGGLPPQPDDEDFSGLDVDDSEDDDSEDNKEENGATR